MTPAAILFDLDDTILTCPGGDFVKLWRKSVEEHIHLFLDWRDPLKGDQSGC